MDAYLTFDFSRRYEEPTPGKKWARVRYNIPGRDAIDSGAAYDAAPLIGFVNGLHDVGSESKKAAIEYIKRHFSGPTDARVSDTNTNWPPRLIVEV